MATKNSAAKKSVMSAVDALKQLSAVTPTVAPKTKANKWELPLTEEAEILAERWIGAKVVYDPVKARMDNAKDEFNEYAVRIMAEKIFETNNKPSNPLVVTHTKEGKPDHQFQFMMADRFSYDFPAVPEGVSARQHFIDTLTSAGLTEENAENLVDEELDFAPITGLHDFKFLTEGRYGEGREWIESTPQMKEAGSKLALMLAWNGDMNSVPEALTNEERALILKHDNGVKVKAGFYNRVTSYVEDVEQLLILFKFIKPVLYPAYPKFAVNDTTTQQTARIIEAAADILGTEIANTEE